MPRRAPDALRLLFVSLVAIVLVVVCAGAARAQGNYRSSPMGGRTTLLGGTGVVYGQDGAAAFLNPASVLNIDPGRLSFSVNFYAATVTIAPHWYEPGRVDAQRFPEFGGTERSITDANFSSLPSSLCLFFRVGSLPFFGKNAKLEKNLRDARLGLCFATTQIEQFSFASEGVERRNDAGAYSRQSQSILQRFSRFQFGPTYAMRLTERLSIGASIQGSIANHRSALAATGYTTGGPLGRAIASSFWSSSHGTSMQLHVAAGAIYKYGPQSFGVAIEAPSIHLFGSGGGTLFAQESADVERFSNATGEGNFISRTPLRVSLGTGYEGKWGSFELNASFYAAQPRAFSADVNGHRVSNETGAIVDTPQNATLTQGSRGVVNAGVGAEVYVSRRLSLLTGLSTDLSAVRGGALTGRLFNYYPAATNRVAASFGIGSHGEGGDLLIGTELSFGWGERLVVNGYQSPPTLDTTEHKTLGFLLVVAGTTTLRNLVRAVENVKKVFTEPEKGEKPPPTVPARKPERTDVDRVPLPKF